MLAIVVIVIIVQETRHIGHEACPVNGPRYLLRMLLTSDFLVQDSPLISHTMSLFGSLQGFFPLWLQPPLIGKLIGTNYHA